MSLAYTGAKIVGGSALVGFGLSLGKDAYKKTKQNIAIVVLLLLLLVLILAQFFGPRVKTH